MKLRVGFVLIGLLGSALTSNAADMPQAYPPPALIAPAYDWSSFYLGAMGGYGQTVEISETLNGVTRSGSTTALQGGFGGVTLGYNWQFGQIVAGVEFDIAGSDIAHTAAVTGGVVTGKIGAFDSLTGRLGFSRDAWLVYLKAGAAAASNQFDVVNNGATVTVKNTHPGWTVGGGFEYMFLPKWSAKVEYMYAGYSKADYLGLDYSFSVQTIKAGINYNFSAPPVVARY